MKQEMENTPAKSGIEIDPALSVAIRVHEQDTEPVEAASEGEAAVLTAAPGWLHRLTVLAVVLAVAGIYAGFHIGRGWAPSDDGTLSQSALRVMQGQLPHRDFAEIYTGGLSFIHALAFRAFGVNLMSLRLCVFLFFLAWLPAVYYIALRFTSPIAAGAATLLAVAWSFPNYPAAMPSWYNLFFATFGAAALLRYLEVRTRRWLFVAGLCGGASLLIKVIGAYYIAGVLLFLAFLEQSESSRESSEKSSEKSAEESAGVEESKNSWPYRVFSVSALLLFLATVVHVLHSRLGIAELYQFVLPSAVLVGLILTGERSVRAGTRQRFKTIFRAAIPFLVGFISPVIVFLLPYARLGAIGQFLSGVTSSAIARSIELGLLRPVSVEKSIFALALAGLVAAAMYMREFQGKLVSAAVGLGLAVMLVKAATSSEIVLGVWYSAATLTPLVVLLGAAVVLAAGKRSGPTKLQQQRIMVLISLAAVCTLVQYPWAASIYLSYSLPLTLLAAVAIVATAKKQPGTYVLAAVTGFYLLFGAVMLVPDYVYELTHKVGRMDELHLERAGGLRINYAANFEGLIHFLQRHSPNGLMYAGNDCPELYFLSGLKNVTRDDGGAPAEEVLKALQSDDLKVVVINEAPLFPSSRMNPEVRAEVMRKFPNSIQTGFFHVFWRE
ncbi:MAG: glycosyltransferase family 39 protein [Terriglobales bacterium]